MGTAKKRTERNQETNEVNTKIRNAKTHGDRSLQKGKTE